MFRKILILFTLVATAYLNGCASVPMSSLENDAARKSFPSPSPGTAGLYIYRNTTLGGALKKDIFIDGELVAETAPMTYFYFEVQGGKRKLSTESEFSPNDLIVDVEKDKNYFVRQSMRFGVFVGGAGLALVPDEEGKKGVLECKLASNFKGNVMVNTGGIKTPVLTSQSNPGGETSALEYYGQAEEEIITETYDKNLWAKALVEAEGDQTKRKAKYIVLRANQLYSEHIGSIGSLDLSIKTTTPVFNLTGIYYLNASSDEISSIFPWIFNGKKKFKFDLTQEDDVVTGRFLSMVTGAIKGTLEQDKLKFDWYTGRCSNGHGEMTVSSDGLRLDGSWVCKGDYAVSGKWNAQRL